MYTLSYIIGAIVFVIMIYGVVLIVRKNRQEAIAMSGIVLGVIVVLSVIKWLI